MDRELTKGHRKTQGKIPDPPWWTSRRRQSPEQGALSRDEIARRALLLVDEEGLEALSLRRLADELGVGKTTILWHVGSKDELLDVVLDLAFADIEEPHVRTEPREELEHLARSVRGVLTRHQGVAPLVGDRPGIGPNSLRLIEYTLSTLARAGLNKEAAVAAYVALLTYVTGFSVWESRNLRSANEIGPERYASMVLDYLNSLPQSRFPEATSSAHLMTNGDFTTRFEQGLVWLLNSILQ